MKKIYSFLMALSIVLCANANSFEVVKPVENSIARPQISKKVNVTPSQVATPVINKTIQVKKQSLRAQQQESKAIARQAQTAPAVKVNGVRGAEVATMPTAAKQVMPVATKNKQMAAAQVTEATDTVEIVGHEWTYEYYSDTKDWYMAVIDASQTYVVRLDYLVAEEDFAGTYNIDNLDLDYSYLTIYDEDRNKTYVNYVEADFTVSVTDEGKFLTANLLCENGIRYLVSAEELPLPEPIGNAELAYTNATLVDGTRSSETFQFWADENGIYTSFLIASDQVVGEYTQDDMYVAYANYIMFVDGTDTTFVDFLGFDMAITKEGQTYNLVADALGSDTIMYHITMSYTKPAPTDTIDIVATNMAIDEFEFWGMYFCEVSASNADYTVTLDMANGLPLGELTYEDFNVEYSSVYRIADATEIVLDDIISATVSMVDGQRAIKAQVVGVDNILYNLDLSYVIPEATDTVNVVFDQAAVATYYAQFGDYYIYNESKDYLVSLDIFEEEGNLMGEYTAEDFDLEYTQVGVVADSTVVTIVDAKAVVTPVEEDIVHIVAELLGQNGTLYIINTDVDVSKKGLEHDATEGFLVDEYTTEDIYTISDYSNYGFIYFDVEAADGTDLMGLQFWVDAADENTIIPVGTYPINGSMEPGTVMASAGLTDEGLTYSLYGTMDEEGYIVPPCWFMTGGEVVVTEEDGVLKIAVDAVNSNNLIIYVTCEYDLSAQQASLPNDATAADGAVERNYGKEDQIWVGNFAKDWGMVYVDIAPADESEWLGLGFVYNEFEGEIIPEGTYEINASGEAGTVAASQGIVNDFITESYFAAGDEEGNLVAPFYFLVSGTVVVEHVDGQMKVTVDAVNSNGVPVHIVYDPTAGSGNDKTPLQYDATEGAVDRTYSTEEVIINKGTGYFQVQATAADKSDKVALVLFGAEDDETIIPVGTYEINGTQAAGTALASNGVEGNSVTLSFYGKTNAAGNILVPCYFFVEGTVEVSAADGKLTIEVNAVNSYDVPVHAIMEYDLNTKQGLQYDAPSGAVDRTYTNEEITFNEGNGYFQIVASSATASDKVAMVLFAGKDENTIIPVGTYEINGTQTTGTVLASSGVNGNSVTLSFYGKTNAAGSILVPCYFFVGGTVEVSAADGILTIEVNAVNSYDVPVHIVMTYDLNTKQGLKYDEQTGSVDRTYTSKDNIVIDTDWVMFSNLFVDIVAEDYSDQLSLQFFVSEADEEIGIPVGTYPITNDNKMNTILAGQGVSESGSVAPSFYSTLVEQEGELYLDKLYFLVSGQAVVEKINGKLKMTIDAVNSYDVPIHIVYDGTEGIDTSIENVTVDTNASKVIENNQLFIMKEGVMYNVLGSVVK